LKKKFKIANKRKHSSSVTTEAREETSSVPINESSFFNINKQKKVKSSKDSMFSGKFYFFF
jgi:hypothetical protein